MRKDVYGLQETQSANSRLQKAKPNAKDILAHAQATVINVNVPQKAAAPAIGAASTMSRNNKKPIAG